MKDARHHIKNAGSVSTAPAGSLAKEPTPPLSLLRLLASVGDGVDEDTIETWTDVLRPRRHEPS
jgi:hypothetical protein